MLTITRLAGSTLVGLAALVLASMAVPPLSSAPTATAAFGAVYV